MGVAAIGAMADDAHDMGLIALLVDGVAHRLAVDGKALVFFAIAFVPALQGAVEFHWIDADEQIADDVFTRHQATPLFATAAETLSRLGSEALGPVRDGFVTARNNRGQTTIGFAKIIGDSSGLAMPRTLVGGKPTWVIASHEPSIEPCCAAGNRRVDA